MALQGSDDDEGMDEEDLAMAISLEDDDVNPLPWYKGVIHARFNRQLYDVKRIILNNRRLTATANSKLSVSQFDENLRKSKASSTTTAQLKPMREMTAYYQEVYGESAEPQGGEDLEKDLETEDDQDLDGANK